MAIAECAPPQTYTEIRAFLGLIGHYRWFIKGFVQIAQPLNEHLAGEGASQKLEQVSLSNEALEAFQALKGACMKQSCVSFCQLCQRLFARNRHFQIGIRSSPVPETRGWMVSPGGLWQPGTHHT